MCVPGTRYEEYDCYSTIYPTGRVIQYSDDATWNRPHLTGYSAFLRSTSCPISALDCYVAWDPHAAADAPRLPTRSEPMTPQVDASAPRAVDKLARYVDVLKREKKGAFRTMASPILHRPNTAGHSRPPLMLWRRRPACTLRERSPRGVASFTSSRRPEEDVGDVGRVGIFLSIFPRRLRGDSTRVRRADVFVTSIVGTHLTHGHSPALLRGARASPYTKRTRTKQPTASFRRWR